MIALFVSVAIAQATLKSQSYNAAQKILENEDAPAATATPSAASPPQADGPAKAKLIVGDGSGATSLFLKIGGSLVRFQVEAAVTDQQIDDVVRALRSACVKTAIVDATCDPSKRSSLEVDRTFVAVARESQGPRWSKVPPTYWSIACASGEECLAPSAKFRHFVLTTKKTENAIARGFDSMKARTTGKDVRLEKVYATRPHSPRTN